MDGDERDSLSIIKKCQSKIHDKSQVGAIIRNIKQMEHGFQEIIFSFVPRESNGNAHNLAKVKLKGRQQRYLERRGSLKEGNG